ncbi:hypothetical protein cypCar_00046102, partial [Cyprinus carpio]
MSAPESLDRVELCGSLLTWQALFPVGGTSCPGPEFSVMLVMKSAPHNSDPDVRCGRAVFSGGRADQWSGHGTSPAENVCEAQTENHNLKYIQTIMMMEESVQHVVMTAIQELMSKETPVSSGSDSYVELDRQLKKTVEELNDALATKEEIAQRCHELDMQAYLVQEERDRL